MQIYLPFSNVKLNVSVLNERDLTHQRNVALTILETIAGKSKGWQWHPGVNMWYGCEELLAYIAIAIDAEWAEQASLDPRTTPAGIKGLSKVYGEQLRDLGFTLSELVSEPSSKPWWWNHKRFHDGEQAAMLRKDREWYGQFFTIDISLIEWWPRMEPGKFVYGPHRGPNPDYTEYSFDDKPILAPVQRMADDDFARHVNTFHNLMPDMKQPINSKWSTLPALRVLHDRFHTKRMYTSHDHEG